MTPNRVTRGPTVFLANTLHDDALYNNIQGFTWRGKKISFVKSYWRDARTITKSLIVSSHFCNEVVITVL